MEQNVESVTGLLKAWNGGDEGARERLMPMVYEHLHNLAQGYLRREQEGHTLQPTALVNELYLRLVGQKRMDWKGRAQFLAVSASLMRRVLVDHARSRKAVKRGGEAERITLQGIAMAESDSSDPVDVLALNRALEELAEADAQQARLVELRYFAGLTIAETATCMEISPATVKREWNSARAWLWTELRST